MAVSRAVCYRVSPPTPIAPAAFPWTASFLCVEKTPSVSPVVGRVSYSPRGVSALLVFLCQCDECVGLAVSADQQLPEARTAWMLSSPRERKSLGLHVLESCLPLGLGKPVLSSLVMGRRPVKWPQKRCCGPELQGPFGGRPRTRPAEISLLLLCSCSAHPGFRRG